METKARTKGQRLIEVIEVFQAITNDRPFTVQEVTAWAIERGLYPVPTRGSSQKTRDEWDRKLAQLKG